MKVSFTGECGEEWPAILTLIRDCRSPDQPAIGDASYTLIGASRFTQPTRYADDKSFSKV